MIISLAILAYFKRMKDLFIRQGFDESMKVIYNSDDEGKNYLLDKDMANKDMNRKSGSSRDTIRKDPYSMLYWDRTQLTNINRNSYRIVEVLGQDNVRKAKKTVSGSFSIQCVLVSNKANMIEDFEEAFAAEYQNIHNIELNLKTIYEDPAADKLINFTVTQELGNPELKNFRIGNLFSYSWSARIHMNYVSEFAQSTLVPLEKIQIYLHDWYNPWTLKDLGMMEFYKSQE